ncbi:hypothetical protein ACSSS7_007617 [Eimeria intestinalis]
MVGGSWFCEAVGGDEVLRPRCPCSPAPSAATAPAAAAAATAATAAAAAATAGRASLEWLIAALTGRSRLERFLLSIKPPVSPPSSLGTSLSAAAAAAATAASPAPAALEEEEGAPLLLEMKAPNQEDRMQQLAARVAEHLRQQQESLLEAALSPCLSHDEALKLVAARGRVSDETAAALLRQLLHQLRQAEAATQAVQRLARRQLDCGDPHLENRLLLLWDLLQDDPRPPSLNHSSSQSVAAIKQQQLQQQQQQQQQRMNVTTWLLAELQRGLLLPFLLPPLPPPDVLLRVPAPPPPAAAAAAATAGDTPTAAAAAQAAAAAAAQAAAAAAAAADVDEGGWYLPFSAFGVLHSFVFFRFLDFWVLLSPPSIMRFAEQHGDVAAAAAAATVAAAPSSAAAAA